MEHKSMPSSDLPSSEQIIVWVTKILRKLMGQSLIIKDIQTLELGKLFLLFFQYKFIFKIQKPYLKYTQPSQSKDMLLSCPCLSLYYMKHRVSWDVLWFY